MRCGRCRGPRGALPLVLAAGLALAAAGCESEDVVLPEGVWESLWDRDQAWTGPATITVDAPLDTIPVFVRPEFDVVVDG